MTNILFSLAVFAASQELITEDGLSILHELQGTDDYHLSDQNELIYIIKPDPCIDRNDQDSN